MSDRPADHKGHWIRTFSPDMAGRPVVVCADCNVRLANDPRRGQEP